MHRVIVIAAIGLAALAAAILSGGAAPASAKPKTLEFTSTTKSEKRVGKYTFVSFSIDKADGKVVGYDVITGGFDPKTEIATFDVALALDGGFVYGAFKIKGDADVVEGNITGGTGDYEGAEGTITATDATRKKSFITVTFD